MRVPPAVRVAGGAPPASPPFAEPDGFVPVEDAARRMRTTPAHVRRLALGGFLERRGTGEGMRVRPAKLLGAVPAAPPPEPDPPADGGAGEARDPRRRRRVGPLADRDATEGEAPDGDEEPLEDAARARRPRRPRRRPTDARAGRGR